MKILEVAATRKSILAESCCGLTEPQKYIVEGIVSELSPLFEVDLSADQIKQIFAAAEQGAAGLGNNRTAIGKTKDAAGAVAGAAVDTVKLVNQTINNVGKWLQNTAPVQAADQKFEQLKSAIGQKFPDLDKNLTAMGTWMKGNPGKSAAIIGVMTAIASLAAGPAGGAIAGQILRGTSGLIKGEKLSTAVGQGIKTAALGYLSGKAFEMLGDYVSSMRANAIPFGPKDAGLEEVTYGATRTITAPGITQQEMIKGFKIVAFGDDVDAVNKAMDMIRNNQPGGFDTLQSVARKITSPQYKQTMKDIMSGMREIQLDNDSLIQWIKGMAQAGQALSQGAVAAASTTGGQPAQAQQPTQQPTQQTQSVIRTGKAINEFVDRDATVRQWALQEMLGRPRSGVQLTEAGVGDMFSKAANWAKTKGNNLTNKVTADKLTQAWTKAGSPADSEKVAWLMIQAGVPEVVIKDTYRQMGINSPISQPPGEENKSAGGGFVSGLVKGVTGKGGDPVAGSHIGIPSARKTTAGGIGQPADTDSQPAQDTQQPAQDTQQPAQDTQQPAPGQSDTLTKSDIAATKTTEPGAPVPASPEAPAAEPAQAAPAKMSVSDFASKLETDFENFASAGGSIGAPAVKRALKNMWMRAGGTKAESKSNKKKPV